MTIIEIKNQLIAHFYDSTVFDMEVDGGKIRLTDELERARREVLTTVLNDLVTKGMLVRVESPEKAIWVLTQSFDSFSQSLILSAASADVIADLINEFRDANEIPGDLCDKTRITEADIMNLVNICHVLLESEAEDFGLVDEEDDEVAE